MDLNPCIIAPDVLEVLGKAELNCLQACPGRGVHITTRVEADRVKLIGRARTVIAGMFTPSWLSGKAIKIKYLGLACLPR